MFAVLLHGFGSIFRFADDLEILTAVQEGDKAHPDDKVIVHDEEPDLRRFGHAE
jgi:hypothetical protein